MKIKTIVDYSPADFDERVNQALTENYILAERSTLPPDAQGVTAHYAQLVLPDPPAEPEPFDPIQALHQVRAFCNNVPASECNADRCPLKEWCDQLRNGGDPTDWDLPEVDA